MTKRTITGEKATKKERISATSLQNFLNPMPVRPSKDYIFLLDQKVKEL